MSKGSNTRSTETPFGKYLRGKRVAAGLSLRHVADELGVTHVYLGEVERGVRGPLARERWADLIKIVPGVTLDDLERMAGTTRPVQLSLGDAPPKYQDLGLALARRIENRDLKEVEINRLLRILRGSEK